MTQKEINQNGTENKRDTQNTVIYDSSKVASCNINGNSIPLPQVRKCTPVDPLAKYGIIVTEGTPYEDIVNRLVNNKYGKKFGVKIKGKRLANELSGEIFVPTKEEEPYNNQIRIDNAKIQFEGDYPCVFEVTPKVNDFPDMWERFSHLVKIEKGRHLIKTLTKVRYGKGGVMDDIEIITPEKVGKR